MGAGEAGEETGKKINLTIKFPNREDMSLLVKPTTPFSKIYAAVAKAMGVETSQFILNWDETKLNPTENPKMHEFGDDEQLDYFVHQVGGADAEARNL